MNRTVKVWHIGKIKYLESLQLQATLTELHHKYTSTPNVVLFVEHPPVYTVGIRTNAYTTADEEKLKQTGIHFNRLLCLPKN